MTRVAGSEEVGMFHAERAAHSETRRQLDELLSAARSVVVSQERCIQLEGKAGVMAITRRLAGQARSEAIEKLREVAAGIAEGRAPVSAGEPLTPPAPHRYEERHKSLNELCRYLRFWQTEDLPLPDEGYDALFDILADYDNLCHDRDTIERANACEEMVSLQQKPTLTLEEEARIGELRAYLDEKWEKATYDPSSREAMRIVREAATILRKGEG